MQCSSRRMSPVVAALTINSLRGPRKGKRGDRQKVVSPQQLNLAWPLMAAQPNGIPLPSAEVRRVAFSGRGQDQIELSAWHASASDATDNGLTGLDAPNTPTLLHPQAHMSREL